MKDSDLQSILERLTKLEHAVFSINKRELVGSIKKSEYVGVVGGIRWLLFKGFFDKKKLLSEVKAELSMQDYHYSLQAAQTALNRLSKPSGPLVTFREGGKKVYAKRK